MKLSIVIPVYNVEEYLRKCLDSLVNQTRKDYQLIIVNDGTKDNSQSIINEYVNKYPSLIKSYIKENGGLSDARNYGLKYVDTPYVMFIDSDDYVSNNMVEICLNEVEKYDLDLLVFGYYQYKVVSNSVEQINLKMKDGIYNLKDKPELLAYTPNAAWNKIYKTTLFKDNNFLYPKGLLYEDLATTPKILYKANKIGYLNVPLYHYLVDRPNNITKQVDKRIFDVIKVSESLLRYFKEENIFEHYYDELYYLTFLNCVENLRKVIKCKDAALANSYIDAVFDFVKENFPKKSPKYDLCLNGNNKVYLNRTLCKLYYKIKNR